MIYIYIYIIGRRVFKQAWHVPSTETCYSQVTSNPRGRSPSQGISSFQTVAKNPGPRGQVSAALWSDHPFWTEVFVPPDRTSPLFSRPGTGAQRLKPRSCRAMHGPTRRSLRGPWSPWKPLGAEKRPPKTSRKTRPGKREVRGHLGFGSATALT